MHAKCDSTCTRLSQIHDLSFYFFQLEDLPHIVLVEILRHLDANALRKVSRISRKLQEVAHSTPKLWSKSSLFIATDSDESIFQ